VIITKPGGKALINQDACDGVLGHQDLVEAPILEDRRKAVKRVEKLPRGRTIGPLSLINRRYGLGEEPERSLVREKKRAIRASLYRSLSESDIRVFFLSRDIPSEDENKKGGVGPRDRY